MAQQKLFRNSLCCCTGGTCTCTSSICVQNCSGTRLSGAIVAIGSYPPLTTGPAGCTAQCLDSTGGAGSYQVTVNLSGYQTYNQTVSLNCSPTSTIITLRPSSYGGFTIQGVGCNSSVPTNQSIQIAGGTYGPTDPIFLTGTGTYAYTITSYCFAPYTGNVVLGSICPSLANISVNLTPSSSCECCTGGCISLEGGDAYPDVLNLTDSDYGVTTLTYNATTHKWVGTINVNYPGCIGCPASTTVYTYTFCPSSAICLIVSCPGPPAKPGCPGVGTSGNTQTPSSQTVTTYPLSAVFSMPPVGVSNMWCSLSPTVTVTP